MTQLTPAQAFHEAQRLLRMGEYPRAGSLTQQLVQNLPDEPAIRGLHGAALARLGRSAAGIVLMKQALEKSEDDRVRQFLAIETSSALRRLHRGEEALDMAETAIGCGAENEDAQAVKAEALIDLGRLDEAKQLIESWDGDDAVGLAIAWGRACLLGDDAASGVERVSKASKRIGTSAVDLTRLLRVLGQLCERTGATDQAFDAWRRAAKLTKGEFDAAGHHKVVEGLIEQYTPSALGKISRAAGHGERNVFLIGPPGSGHELVEGIIASHSTGFGCGEIGALATVCRGKLGAETTSFRRVVTHPTRLRGKQLTEAATAYSEEINKLCPDGTTHVADAQPMNVYHAGLLPLMMPDARIVLCTREPIEAAMSTFAAVTGATFARDLEDLGSYTRDVVALCEHWSALLVSVGAQVHTLRFEDLTANTEPTVRHLLEFLGLGFEEACLTPETSALRLLEPSDEARLPMSSQITQRGSTYAERTKALRNGLGI